MAISYKNGIAVSRPFWYRAILFFFANARLTKAHPAARAVPLEYKNRHLQFFFFHTTSPRPIHIALLKGLSFHQLKHDANSGPLPLPPPYPTCTVTPPLPPSLPCYRSILFFVAWEVCPWFTWYLNDLIPIFYVLRPL